MRYLSILLLLICAVTDSVAEGRRGLVTTTSCPFTCEDAGLTSDVCKERRVGDKCQVEDMTQAPGHRSMIKVPASKQRASMNQEAPAADDSRRGLITSSRCPFTCADLGVPNADCREKQMGDTCQVEDLRQAPGHRSLVRMPR